MSLTDSQKKDILEEIYSEKEVSFELVNRYFNSSTAEDFEIRRYINSADLDDYTELSEETWSQWFYSLGINKLAFKVMLSKFAKQATESIKNG